MKEETALRPFSRLDLAAEDLAQLPQVDLHVVHRFTPGLYIREVTMKAGTLAVSKTHKKEHPYVVSKGCVSVYIEGQGTEVIEAPYTGVTKPGVQRLLLAHEDTVWTTFHVTDETDLKKIEAECIAAPGEPLLTNSGEQKPCLGH